MQKINEGLEHKDMVGLIKPVIHIDEFVSKMGNDDDIATVSFYVKNNKVADDLVNWFEQGYKFVLDADRSPGEIKPNRYLVYVELKRRTSLPDHVQELIRDLETLTEWTVDDWTVEYDGSEMGFDIEYLNSRLLLSPKAYRIDKEGALNQMREQADIKTVPLYDKDDKDIQVIQSQANII